VERTLALQVIEANLNRFREGIRVAEDLLRYTPGAEGEFSELKKLRLDAGAAERETRRVLGDELSRARRLHQDAGKDKTPSAELARSDIAEIVTANLKRAQEAARTIEELTKLTTGAALSRRYKKLRFAIYSCETEVISKLAALSKRARFREALERFPVYLVIDDLNTSAQTPVELVAKYHKAGGRVTQLRMKDASAKARLMLARELQRAFPELMLIINDRVDLARAAGAFGVHLGPQDLPLSALFDVRGDLLLGVSAGGAGAAKKAVASGADYIGVGAIQHTETKSHMRVVGVAGLREVAQTVDVPVVAIGGITAGNLAEVLKAGATGCAVISAVSSPKGARKLYAEARKLAKLS
jgi:thiamine-phosphate pyrophosphorylase